MMDTQYLFNVAVSIAGFLGGWVLNNIYQTLRVLDKDVRQMPLNYVAKDDYRRDIDEVKEICRQIFAKLDNKADKP
ncbi:MAG: hypothetical protein ACK528_00675 [Alphaproteobacteria bacterium]|jgi:hypothetical protein